MRRTCVPLAQGIFVCCLLLSSVARGGPKAFTVGGAITGLKGSGLILRNQKTDQAVGANGPFVLPMLAASGEEYSVRVVQQPKSPTQACAVINGSGVVSNANVTNIVIDCVTQGHWRAATQVDQAALNSVPEARKGNDGVQIAMDAKGNAIAVWNQPQVGVWSARYVAGSGWQTPQLIGSGAGSEGAAVDIDSLGNAVAVWDQPVGGQRFIWANRFTTGAGWGTAAPIESHTGGDASSPKVSLSGNGDALAVWRQRIDALNTLNVWALRLSPAGLGVPQQISSGAGAARNLELARDTQGNALALWEQFDAAQNVSVWSSRFDNSP
jgi:hypothetical protein